MKKQIMTAGLIAALACSALAQSADYSIREVRDPVQFRAKLNDDMTDIESRLAVTESVTNGGALAAGKILVGDAAGIVAAQTLSGNATMTTSGVVTVTGAAGNMTVVGATTTGTARVTGALSLGSTLTMTSAATAAPTNALSAGRLITVNGTNYWIGLYPVNN